MPTTDFARMDMLGQTPAPSTAVDICMSEGFKLNSGASIYDGSGVMLVDGEAFAWQPWGPDMKLINHKGQWEVKEEAFALLGLLWPRPGKTDRRPSPCVHHHQIAMADLFCFYRFIDSGTGRGDAALESGDEEAYK